MADRIRDMEPSQRPRERLVREGARALSEAELLAVLLRTGRRGRSAVAEAQDLLASAGGLAGVAGLEVAELLKRPGVGEAKASAVAAALEIGRRMARAEIESGLPLDQPERAGEYLVQELRGERREIFGGITLDGRHRFMALHRLAVGTRRQAPVDVGELFRKALLDGASGLLLFHNHPSAGLSPSADDVALTRRLVEGGSVVGVAVLDHLIVADSKWLSLRCARPELFETRSPGS
jgi:DNA repair protein RadC